MASRPDSRKKTGSTTATAATGERVPPHSSEAEGALLGSILIDNKVLDIVNSILKPEDFYIPAYRIVFESMQKLGDSGYPLDIVTLSDDLKRSSRLEMAGGSSFLARLTDQVVSSARAEDYAKLVKEKASVRQMITAASQIAASGFGDYENAEEFLDTAEQQIFEAARSRMQSSYYSVTDVIQETFHYIEESYARGGTLSGISTGYSRLDNMTAGLQPGELIIVAGRPGMGKTSLALNFALYASLKEKRSTVIFSLEMSRVAIGRRILCMEGRVDANKMRRNILEEKDYDRLIRAADRISPTPLFIDDTPAISTMEIRSKARRLKREKNLELIIVDYLQLVRPGSKRYDSREQEISDISRSLKALAKELEIPVIALSQLNRSVESRADKRPVMSDLRESGAIEQDSDLIMFIYRDDFYNQTNLNMDAGQSMPSSGIAEIIIGKQRNGPTGMVELIYFKDYTSFSNYEKNLDEPPPSTDAGMPFA